MKHLFRCLFAALCAAGLSVSAFADVLPIPRAEDPTLVYLVLAVAAVAAAILVILLRKRRK